MFRHIFPLILSLLAVSQCVRIGHIRGPQERAEWDKLTSPPLSSWSPRAINVATLGHRGLYDDFITVWALQFLASHDLKNYGSVEKIHQAVTSVTHLRPRIESIYLLSCFVLGLDLEHPEYCEEISRDGLAVFPQSWRITMTQGFIEEFKLKNHMRAAAYYAMAASIPTSPAWVTSLAKRLVNRGAAEGQNFDDSFSVLEDVPGGDRILEIIRPKVNGLQLPEMPPLPPPQTQGGSSP